MITQSTYKNMPAVTLTFGGAQAVVLPGTGGKLASLKSKSGTEYLFRRPNATYREQPFDGIYVDGECSGFDDMFPAIDSGYYDKYPWEGTKIACHGEVWSLPWEQSATGDKLGLTVYGVRFPYKLTKTIYFKNEQTLRADYKLQNLSAFDFSALWAGHMMVNMTEGTRVEVPKHLKSAVTTIGKSGRAGSYGHTFAWPGETERFDIARDPSVEDVTKFYFTERLKQGYCSLAYPDGNRLTVRFPAAKVPYLGVMLNEKGWDDIYHAIIEPCTAPFDRYDRAEARGAGFVLKANSSHTWYLEIEMTEGDQQL